MSEVKGNPFRVPNFNWRLLLVISVAARAVTWLILPMIQSDLGTWPRDGDIYRVDLKQLGSFGFDPEQVTDKSIPARFRNLDGKKVSLEGFECGIRSNGALDCFKFVYETQPHGLYSAQQFILVTVPNNIKTTYDGSALCRITGTLHVKVEKDADSGKITSIYSMDLDHVEPL